MKVHRLNSAWHSTKKENYIKHATREHAIHKVCGRTPTMALYTRTVLYSLHCLP